MIIVLSTHTYVSFSIIPKIYPSKKHTPTSMMAEIAKQQSCQFIFDHKSVSLDLVREMYFYYDLPELLKKREVMSNSDSLRIIVGDLMGRLMSSSCKFYSVSVKFDINFITKKGLGKIFTRLRQIPKAR